MQEREALAPRFSVVIPVHNKARHLRAAIESVRAQTCAPHEIVAIDDASSDGGAEILSSINDPRLVRLRRDVPGPGGYAARNLGIAHASGNWIAFLDADDRWHPDHLAGLAAAIERHPEAGCAATRYLHVHADRQMPSRTSARLAEAAARPVDLAGFLRLWLELRECPIWTGAAAFRRDVLVAAGLFPAGRAARGGDKDLWLRAVARAPFVHVPTISAEFWRDTDNKVSKTTTTTGLPALVFTANGMIARAAPAERRLLRRLVNQQIGLYARFAFKAGRLSPELRSGIYLPEGWRTWLAVSAIAALPEAVRRRIHARARTRLAASR
jgi:glycosyltransferase involved in cell wall biosynthesis